MQLTTPSTAPNRSSAFFIQASIELESEATATPVSHWNSLRSSLATCSVRAVKNTFVPADSSRCAVALAISELPPNTTIDCEFVIVSSR